MGTTTPGVNGTAPPAPGPRNGVRALARVVPPAVVLAALCGIAYWGHRTGWAFPPAAHATPAPPAPGPDESRPAVRFAPADPGAESPFPGGTLEFASARAAEAAGVGIATAWPAPLTEQVTGPGEVGFDPARIARLPARAAGVARQVLGAAGDPARAGDVLALVESADVGKAKAELQYALVQLRLREAAHADLAGAKAATSAALIREAEAALKDAAVRVRAAAQALTNLGLPVAPDELHGLAPAEVARRLHLLGVRGAVPGADEAGLPANLLPVRAPFAGVVLRADVVAGEAVEAGKALFVVVDGSRVRVTVHVGPEDARRVAVGQRVFFRPDGGSGEYPGVVLSVGTAADETTRTLPVWAEAENPAGELRASTLGRGRIVLREVPDAVVVPHAAVHPVRGRSVVFVRHPDYLKPDGPKAFAVRVVRVGGRDDRHAEVIGGVSQGEVVAAAGSDYLLRELTRAAAAGR